MTVRGRLWQCARKCAAPIGDLCCVLLFERSLADPPPSVPNTLDASIRLATEDDVDTICELYAGDTWLWLGSRDLYRDRLRRGEKCFLAFVDGVLAHVNWTCFQWGDALPGLPLLLRPGEVYTTDAFTPPRFRGKGVHALVLGRMLNDARAAGARHAYTVGQLDRPDAHKGLLALGWREIGRVVYFQRTAGSSAIFLWRRGDVSPLFEPPSRRAT
jgi:GNAT superfamily N-acetyltransferase